VNESWIWSPFNQPLTGPSKWGRALVAGEFRAAMLEIEPVDARALQKLDA
jgi:hypothetical protein